MNKIKDQKIEDFLEDLASKSPTPGGGAASALAGAMAAALVEMVCGLTKGDSVQRITDRANQLKIKLLNLADEDCQAFNQVMRAYKSKSKSKIRKALQKAIEIPDKVKTLAEEVEVLANKMAEIGNKNAFSDTKSAIHLVKAAEKSAEENIKINEKALAALKQD